MSMNGLNDIDCILERHNFGSVENCSLGFNERVVKNLVSTQTVSGVAQPF